MPLLRGKTRNPFPWLQILAYPDAASQAFRSRRTILYTAVPVPLNDIFGPCFLYRDFSDALQHPKIHPWTILANDLVPFVSSPLWVRAPGIGQVHSLNSSPPLWGRICANHVLPLSLRTRRPVVAIRVRLRASFALYLAAGQAKERTINDSTPQPAQCQKQPCDASKKTQPASRREASTCTAPQSMHTGRHASASSAMRQRPPHLT